MAKAFKVIWSVDGKEQSAEMGNYMQAMCSYSRHVKSGHAVQVVHRDGRCLAKKELSIASPGLPPHASM